MRKWCKAFTYKPKIDAVLKGECTQTIRPSHNVMPGDEILFHGWEGKSYYSKWSWRMRIVVTTVRYIDVYQWGIVTFCGNNVVQQQNKHQWRDLDWLANDDGIVPPKGIEMGSLFNKYHKLSKAIPKPMQIIRWPWPPLELIKEE